MKKLLANLSYSFAANLASMAVSVLTVLLIPAFWGETAYGYYQLFLFYSSYVGFFHFGWVDGIYLRVGGVPYDRLDRRLYASQFWLLTALAAFLSAAAAMGMPLIFADSGKCFVAQMFCVCAALYLPVTYVSYLFQATGRIRAYALLLLTEKLLFLLLFFALFLAGDRSYQALVLADLFGKAAALLLALYLARKVVFAGLCRFRKTVSETLANLSSGVRLMSANVAGLLLIGVVRFAIEQKWGVEVFGGVSLSISVANLFLTFVTAVSIVLFPALKQTDESRRAGLYQSLRSLTAPLLLLFPLLYGPAEAVLGVLLPAYRESLRYLLLLLPMLVYECRMTLLLNTWLKALRRETQILYVNLLAAGLSMAAAAFTVYGLQSLPAALVGITAVSGVRATVAETYLSSVLRLDFRREEAQEAALLLLFLLAAWNLPCLPATLLYALAYAVWFACRRKTFLAELSVLREEFRKNGGRT